MRDGSSCLSKLKRYVVEQGRCICCAKPMKEVGTKRCRECLDHAAAYMAWYRSHHKKEKT